MDAWRNRPPPPPPPVSEAICHFATSDAHKAARARPHPHQQILRVGAAPFCIAARFIHHGPTFRGHAEPRSPPVSLAGGFASVRASSTRFAFSEVRPEPPKVPRSLHLYFVGDDDIGGDRSACLDEPCRRRRAARRDTGRACFISRDSRSECPNTSLAAPQTELFSGRKKLRHPVIKIQSTTTTARQSHHHS